MNNPMTNAELHRCLADLPDPPLPEALASRLERAHASRSSRHRWGAGVAVAALAVIGLMPHLLGTDSDRMQSEQRAFAAAAPAPVELHAQLRALDRELQAAYARRASDAEIASLWSNRRALLSIEPGAEPKLPSRPIRI